MSKNSDKSMPPPSRSRRPAGHPDRRAAFDVLKGFQNPPADFGEVAFYWWLGDKLTKERLLWQLDKLQNMGVAGLQVNYAHSDKGGNSWGLTYPSDPPLFSEEWWDQFVWWAGECKKRGIAVSLSDYTLGIVGQGWWMDEILAEDPGLHGSKLGVVTDGPERRRGHSTRPGRASTLRKRLPAARRRARP